MVFAVVLAGGMGSRMGNSDTPKQFLILGKSPIIIHTVEKFYVNSKFEKVIVLCPKQWVSHTENIIKKSIKLFLSTSLYSAFLYSNQLFGAVLFFPHLNSYPYNLPPNCSTKSISAPS